MLLTDSVTHAQGIGPSFAELLAKLEINTIQDLLYHAPAYYSDSRELSLLSDFSTSIPRTAEVTLEDFSSARIRGGRSIQNAVISDDSGSMKVIWFNQKYLSRMLAPGDKLLVSGKLNPKSTTPQLSSPKFEKIIPSKQSVHLGGIIPVYRLTAGVSQKRLRRAIHSLVRNIDAIEDLEDSLPAKIRSRFDLLLLKDALINIHIPKSTADIMAARRRLGFDELLEIQKRMLAIRKRRNIYTATKVDVDYKAVRKLLEEFPFTLSDSQTLAVKKVQRYLSETVPMRSLLQGDVGSGKTAVAAVSAYCSVTGGKKVVVMAPTIILATQLLESFTQFLPTQTKIAFISGTTKPTKEELMQADIVIGTHAVLNQLDNLKQNLGLVIIDEQHRFGVAQRASLQRLLDDKTKRPHVLQMTATPIPRTIAQTLFKDVDVIHLEPRRKSDTISTSIVPENKREQCYEWIKTKISENDRIFWVVPAIEDSKEETASIKAKSKELGKIFGTKDVGILNGRMKDTEKLKSLSDFKAGVKKVLLSTTVIEVGIDVPESSVMIIESSERFGLAQLHQLRGRVGRAGQQAWCMLFTNDPESERLQAFTKLTDGTALAEFDLASRGPGEVYGTVQSGIPSLKVANFSNIELMKQALSAAEIMYPEPHI